MAASGTLYKEKELLQFGGLNNRDTSNLIEDYQAQDLLNVHFDNKGEITKRNGYTAFLGAQIDSNPVVSLFLYQKSNGANYLLATSGTSIYNVSSGSAVAIKTALTGNGKRFTSATYLDTLYMVNGTDGIMKWDGTTFSVVAGLPFSNAQYITVHKNRMYYAGDPSSPSRVWISDLGAPETVQPLNFLDINTNDGDVITGLVEHLDSLVAFKERSLHVLRGTGPQNYTLLDSHQNHGTVSHWSVANVLNRLYYLSRDGVYYFDGKEIHLASDVIRGSVLGLNGNAAWNQQYLSKACGIQYLNKYWLALPEGTGATANNRIYLLDYTHGTWTRYDILVSCFCLYPTNFDYQLYSGSPAVGMVYLQDSGSSDAGVDINAYFHGKDIDFGYPAHFKSFKGLFFYAREEASHYTIDMTYYEDFDRSQKTIPLDVGPLTSIWGDNFLWGGLWGSSERVVSKTTSVSGQCRYLSFKVSDTSANPWVFLGWVIQYKLKKRLR